MTFSFSSRAVVEAGRRPIVPAIAGCGLALYLWYDLARFRFSTVWPPTLRGDAGIVFDYAARIFEQASYPTAAIFPYSPSAVIVFHGLGVGGPAVFMAVWYLLMVMGLVVTMRAGLAQERYGIKAAWLAIGALAVLLALSPISWDLRNVNSNLIYLGVAMAGYGLLGPLPILAGMLIGVSISLKLYSGLLLLWLLVNGLQRAAAATVITIIVLWVVLPVALFGTDGALSLYAGWIEQLRTIGDPALHASLATREGGPPLITLHTAVTNFTGEAYGSATTQAWLVVLWSIWGSSLLWYAWRCRTAFPVAAPSRAALADWTVMLLAPLPFSPWLEPYHGIPLFVGALLCVAVSLDEGVRRSDRLAALAGMTTLLLFVLVRVPFAVRGFGLCTQLLVLVLVFGFIRPRLAAVPAQR